MPVLSADHLTFRLSLPGGHEFTLAIVLAHHIHELRKSIVVHLHTVGTEQGHSYRPGRIEFFDQVALHQEPVTSLRLVEGIPNLVPHTVHNHAGVIAVAHHHSAGILCPPVLKV